MLDGFFFYPLLASEGFRDCDGAMGSNRGLFAPSPSSLRSGVVDHRLHCLGMDGLRADRNLWFDNDGQGLMSWQRALRAGHHRASAAIPLKQFD